MAEQQGKTHLPGELLEHFLATTVDYADFSATLPLPTKLIFEQPPIDRWTVVAHAMMLRKYFSGYYKDQRQGDPLNLNAVIRALRESIVDPEISDETWDGMEENVKRLESHTRYRINGVDKPELKIVEDELYGRYLHGEANRWRGQDVSRHGVDSALWSMTHNRAKRVRSVELLVRERIENGLLQFGN